MAFELALSWITRYLLTSLVKRTIDEIEQFAWLLWPSPLDGSYFLKQQWKEMWSQMEIMGPHPAAVRGTAVDAGPLKGCAYLSPYFRWSRFGRYLPLLPHERPNLHTSSLLYPSKLMDHDHVSISD